MRKIVSDNKILFSFFAFVLCAVTCFVLTNTTVQTAHAGSGTADNTDFSLAKISESAAIYVNQMTAPSMHGVNEIDPSLLAGNAGGFVGFIDDDSTDKAYTLCSRVATNTVSWSIDALQNRVYTGQGATQGTAPVTDAAGYARYGYVLSQMGLDTVGNDAEDASLRRIVGIAFMALYIMAIGMSSFFNLAITILQAANPFRMFSTARRHMAGQGGEWISPYTEGGSGVGGIISSALYDFSAQVGQLYDKLFDISLFILIPFFLAVAIFMWLIVQKGRDFGKAFKPLFVRVIFICIGVPLMFGLYDAMLTAVKGTVSAAESPATKVVGSLFCDFEAWAGSDNNLALPPGVAVSYTNDDGRITSDTLARTRTICYKVNQMIYSGSGHQSNPFSADLGVSGSSGLQEYVDYDTTLMATTSKPEYQIGVENPYSPPSNLNDIGVVLGILQRYASGTKVSSAIYDSTVAKELLATDTREALILFNTSSTWKDFDSDQIAPFEYTGNDGQQTRNSKNAAIAPINMTEAEAEAYALGRWNGSSYGSLNIFSNGHLDGGRNASHRHGNNRYTFTGMQSQALSTLAMYNYLNSKFEKDGVIVTSPNSTSNELIRNQHYAVSMAGSGFMRIIYALDCLVLLGCTSLIGYGYGFAMMIGNFKALFQMIPKVMAGMLGSVRAIAGALVLTFALICEVVGTVLFFDIAMTVVYAMYNLVEAPLGSLLGAFSGLDATGGGIVTALLAIISIVLIVTLTQKLLQWRSAIVSGMTAACTQMVNKLLQTTVSPVDLESGNAGALGKLATAGVIAANLGAASGAGSLAGEGGTFSDAQSALSESLNRVNNDPNSLTDVSKAIEGELGVKQGSGVTSGSVVSSSSNSISEDAARELQNEQSNADRATGDSTDTFAKSYFAANGDTLENLGTEEEEEGNPLADDVATDKTALHWLADTEENRKRAGLGESNLPDGTYSKDNGDGTHSTIKKTTLADGSVEIEEDVFNSTTNAHSTSRTLTDANGDIIGQFDKSYDNGVTTTNSMSINAKTGAKTVKQEVHSSAGRTVVEQTITSDGAGNVTTETMRSDSATGVSEFSTEVVNTNSGNSTINRTVTDKANGTTVINETRQTQRNGNVVINSEVSNADGTKNVVTATENGSGQIISSDETVYSSSNKVIEHIVTNVQTNNNMIVTNTQTVAGGVKTMVVDTYDTNKDVGKMVTSQNGVMSSSYYKGQGDDKVFYKTTSGNGGSGGAAGLATSKLDQVASSKGWPKTTERPPKP